QAHAPLQQHDAREERHHRHRACADCLHSSFPTLTTWSSIVMRRFFCFASVIVEDCAGETLPWNCGTAFAGELSACVHSTAWSAMSGPYFLISLYTLSARWNPRTKFSSLTPSLSVWP